MRKFILVGGKKVEVNIFGKNKKTLILVPGWLHNFQEETNFINLLSKKYKVVTISYPGYGQSEENPKAQNLTFLATIVDNIARSLNLKNYRLLAFSMGCQVALRYINDFNKKAKAILVSPVLHDLKSDTPFYGKIIIYLPSLLKIVRKIYQIKLFLVNTALKNIGSLTENKAKNRTFKEGLINVSLNGAFDTIIAAVSDYIDPLIFKDQLSFIFGSKEVLQNGLPKSVKYKVIPGAGHGAFKTHYKEIVKLIGNPETTDHEHGRISGG